MPAPHDIVALLDPAHDSSAFELFIGRLLEHDDEWKRFGRATDGIDSYRVVESSPTRTRLCGRVWEVAQQTLHMFWLDIEREHEGASEARWAFYFDSAEPSGHRGQMTIDTLSTPEDIAWRVALSGRALLRKQGVTVTSVDGLDGAQAKCVVHETERVQLVLDPPGHGWLQFRLRLGDFELKDAASNVLNDPIQELADCIDMLATRQANSIRICLWLEPTGYAIDIETALDLGASVTVWSHPAFIPPMTNRRMRQEWSGVLPQEILHAQLRAALVRWLENTSDDEMVRWSKAAEYRPQLRSRL